MRNGLVDYLACVMIPDSTTKKNFKKKKIIAHFHIYNQAHIISQYDGLVLKSLILAVSLF